MMFKSEVWLVSEHASPGGGEDSDLEDSQLDCSLAEVGEEHLGGLDDMVDAGVARRPQRHKDSPTPDRESIHIDDMEPVIHATSANSSMYMICIVLTLLTRKYGFH